MNAVTAHRIAASSLIALILLCLAWELRLAPVIPGGSWLALKCLPLLLPLRGVLAGRRYTFQWSTLLILFYLCEGVVRVTTDTGSSRGLAGLETLLAALYFWSAIAYVRRTRPGRP